MGAGQRLGLRKKLRTNAVFTIHGAASITMQTVDIAKYGVGLVGIPGEVERGQRGRLTFTLVLNGNPHPFDIKVRVAYCLPAGDVFRVGLQFLDIEPAMALLLAFYVDAGDQ